MNLPELAPQARDASADTSPFTTDTLGQKGLFLRHALALGCPVPPGFHVPRGEAFDRASLDEALAQLEAKTGLKIGDENAPLCLSVRSSPRVSQPGKLPTLLNLGCTSKSLGALTARLGSRRAALDTYARSLRARVALVHGAQEQRVTRATRSAAQADERALEAEIKTLEESLGASQDVREAIAAVIEALAKKTGEALVVQSMVYGNGVKSGAGVAHSRDPISGASRLFGEVVWERQGDDLSLGRASGVSITKLAAGRRAEESFEARQGAAFASLQAQLVTLERAFDAPVEVEWTCESGVLHILQVRPSTLAPRAEVVLAVAWAEEGRATHEGALMRVEPLAVAQASSFEVVSDSAPTLGRGLAASPGAAMGVVAIEVEDALARAARGERVILIRSDANPEDAPAVRAAVGVATAAGGLTSHAAVMSRALRRPCAVSVTNLRIDRNVVHVEGASQSMLRPGDVVTVDGTTGTLYAGAARLASRAESEASKTLARWAVEVKTVRLLLAPDGLPNAEERAKSLGADGVAASALPTWEDASQPFPDAPEVIVLGELIHAARVATARLVLAQRAS
jgi:pyruvate,orthophosphate dikinase